MMRSLGIIVKICKQHLGAHVKQERHHLQQIQAVNLQSLAAVMGNQVIVTNKTPGQPPLTFAPLQHVDPNDLPERHDI